MINEKKVLLEMFKKKNLVIQKKVFSYYVITYYKLILVLKYNLFFLKINIVEARRNLNFKFSHSHTQLYQLIIRIFFINLMTTYI